MTQAVPEHHPLLALIDLCHAARSATTVEALGFLLVNDTQRLVAYRQAALWQCQGGIQALSGVMEADGNAPYAQWLHKVCNHLHGLDSAASAQDALAAPPLTPRPVQAGDLPPELAEAWQAWLPAQALWLPLAVAGPRGGGLLLAADAPGRPPSWPCWPNGAMPGSTPGGACNLKPPGRHGAGWRNCPTGCRPPGSSPGGVGARCS